MELKKVRPLKADEIEIRVQQVTENGCSLLLYKDARCDMRLLDELYSPLGWTRKHEVINGNLFCTVSVWDKEKQIWISKQDVGTESNTEKEKGQSSDSFKRACVNFGLGIELYDTPFIWVNLTKDETYSKNGKFALKPSVKFKISQLSNHEDKKIKTLVIVDNFGKERYKFDESNSLKSILSEVSDCQTVFELEGVWNKYPSMRKDIQFVNAVTERKIILQKKESGAEIDAKNIAKEAIDGAKQ